MNTVFFGSSIFVLPIIEFLKKDYRLKLVVTTEHDPNDAVPKYCKKHNIRFISVNSTNNLLNTKYEIQNTKSPVAILAYFGLIIPKEIINIFPKGIVNIHPSLLPKYRGPTPGQTAILNGDKKTGVSIMLLDEEVDHGPILAQEKEIIDPLDTSTTLYERLFSKGVLLLQQVLSKYISGKLKPTDQIHAKATFTKPLTRESGYINLNDQSSIINHQLLGRMIRAYYPWPGVFTIVKINNKDVRIKLLPGKMLQVEGKKPMKFKDFVNGYPEGKAFLEKIEFTQK